MIKTHRELAAHIAGRRVLHLNSLGKDSLACLHWLATFASCDVVSVLFDRIARHPYDDGYFKYLQKRYPSVSFHKEPNPWEINDMSTGVFQSPIRMLTDYADWEHYGFDFEKQADDLAKEWACDFICVGSSRYESVTRASIFHKRGILQGNRIYPIGMLSKMQVLDIVRECGTKLHPCYKLSKSTPDRPSYYKMRSAFLAYPGYKAKMYEIYPLLELDEYRYEVLLGKTK